MDLHDERLFIAWIIEVLTDGGLTVGDSVAPSTVPDGAGYCVVYSIAGGVTEGPLETPRSDAMANVQITSSAVDPAQTRWLVAKARELLDAAIPATVSGRRVIWMDFPTGSTTVARDDDNQPPRYYAPDRIEFGTVPA